MCGGVEVYLYAFLISAAALHPQGRNPRYLFDMKLGETQSGSRTNKQANEFRDFSPPANYTHRATAACRRS
jgi:hypothetical protein